LRLKLSKASQVLHAGGIVAYPTEGVYGLGCDPMNQSAIENLLTLKKRPMSKGLILVAANLEQLKPYIATLSTETFNKIMQSWPGPVNWLLPANPFSPRYLRGKHQLQAVRISEHPVIRDLCRTFGGAIVSTSANLSGRPSARSAIRTRLSFLNKIDYLIQEELGNQKQACEIRHSITNEIIRPSD